jgi:hypothetical protein
MHTDISVNDVKIPLDAVRAEAAHHRHESEPEAAAARALAGVCLAAGSTMPRRARA